MELFPFSRALILFGRSKYRDSDSPRDNDIRSRVVVEERHRTFRRYKNIPEFAGFIRVEVMPRAETILRGGEELSGWLGLVGILQLKPAVGEVWRERK